MSRTIPRCCCNGKASFSGHKPTTEVTDWMFGHAGTTQICAEGVTNICPSFLTPLILLTESNFGEWLILVVTSVDRAAQGTSFCPSVGKAVHTASHLFRGSPALLNSWIYGTLEDGCGALLGQVSLGKWIMHHWPLGASHCS